MMLEITSEDHGGSVLLGVGGEIDLTTVGQFEEALGAAVERAGAEVRVDMDNVTFCGSEGIRALMAAHTAADERDVRLAVVEASPIVRTLLRITDMGRLAAFEL